jgi:hypothetical protein
MNLILAIVNVLTIVNLAKTSEYESKMRAWHRFH